MAKYFVSRTVAWTTLLGCGRVTGSPVNEMARWDAGASRVTAWEPAR